MLSLCVVTGMKYEIKKFSSESFMKGDSTTLEFYLKNIYKLSIESINNNEIDSIVNLFKDLSNDFERIGSYLEIDNEENHQRFLYGMFYAIVTLIIELSEIKEENNNALILFNKYKLLYPILNTISVLHKVSRQELKKALKFKNESNLTNFVSRINKYNLIYIQKLGNTNYYSLTPKGKKTLSLYCVLLQKSENSQLYINEDILIEFLDEISNQLNEEEPSLLSVINVFSRNKIQLKIWKK